MLETPFGAARAWCLDIGPPWVFYHGADVTGLDTGCVWGGSLTALRLDVRDARPVQVGCAAAQKP